MLLHECAVELLARARYQIDIKTASDPHQIRIGSPQIGIRSASDLHHISIRIAAINLFLHCIMAALLLS
jgi:hypothetical protein